MVHETPKEKFGEKAGEALVAYDNDASAPLTPVNHVEKEKRTYEYEYSFGTVYVEDVEEKVEYEGRVYVPTGDVLLSLYEGEEPVVMDRDNVYARVDATNKEARQQAYYALSILAAHGIVSRWRCVD